MTNHPYTLEESARMADIQADSKRRKRNDRLVAVGFAIVYICLIVAAYVWVEYKTCCP